MHMLLSTHSSAQEVTSHEQGTFRIPILGKEPITNGAESHASGEAAAAPQPSTPASRAGLSASALAPFGPRWKRLQIDSRFAANAGQRITVPRRHAGLGRNPCGQRLPILTTAEILFGPPGKMPRGAIFHKKSAEVAYRSRNLGHRVSFGPALGADGLSGFVPTRMSPKSSSEER